MEKARMPTTKYPYARHGNIDACRRYHIFIGNAFEVDNTTPAGVEHLATFTIML
ncbi:MAG: hypothetical protein GXO81_00050 [Chlorobi bacterium]|nr:hypothetical protein [Chlorobiota bacterium]